MINCWGAPNCLAIQMPNKQKSRGYPRVIVVGTQGFPRTALARRLWGNRDDLTALHWSNLLVVEPWDMVLVRFAQTKK